MYRQPLDVSPNCPWVLGITQTVYQGQPDANYENVFNFAATYTSYGDPVVFNISVPDTPHCGVAAYIYDPFDAQFSSDYSSMTFLNDPYFMSMYDLPLLWFLTLVPLFQTVNRGELLKVRRVHQESADCGFLFVSSVAE